MDYNLQTVQDVTPPPLTKPPQKDSDLPAYRYARALFESARAGSNDRIKTFKTNWDWLRGKDQFNQWPRLASGDQWQFRGVVNQTWSTVKTKASILTAAKTEIFVEPLDDQSTSYDRLLVKSANEHEMVRTRFQEVKERVYMSGAVTGIGVSMMVAKPDQLTGAMALVRSHIPTEEFMRDPSVDRISDPNCRFVVWYPLLDMSTVREMFPSKAPLVKTEQREIVAGWTYSTTGDTNLIYGTAGDYAVDRQGMLTSRKARVCFVWVRDESVIEDIQKTLIEPGGEGYHCDVCGVTYPAASMSSDICPQCGQQMEPTTMPDRYNETKEVKRAYPYGRLIVYSGDVLLFDGENPYEIDTVFPFSVYHHDTIPGDFYGGNDVELLQSLQDAENRTICQLVDYVRLAANGPVLYPVAFKSITDMSNAPGQKLPGPNTLPWLPYKLGASTFDVSAWGSLMGSLREQFQVVSGLASLGLGQTSSPPISATEAEIANARLSDRMKGHAAALSQWATDDLTIQDQMMRQFYNEPVTTMVSMPDSELKSIEIEVQKLPKARIRVSVSPGDAVRDKLQGQVAMQFVESGLINSPYAGMFLAKAGFSPNEIREFMDLRSLQQEMAPAQPMGPSPLGLVNGGGPDAQLQSQ